MKRRSMRNEEIFEAMCGDPDSGSGSCHKGGVVTLHADIGYSSEYDLELELNGQPLDIAFTFPDSRGDLVIKCRLAIVKDMVEAGEATFDLTIDDFYTGTDTIRVIDPF